MGEAEKFLKLKDQIEGFKQSKIRLEERLRAEKTKLAELVKEIEARGFDPKDLSNVRVKLEQELKTELESLEKAVAEVNQKLQSLEGAVK